MAITSSILDALTRSLGSAAFAKAAGTYRESEPAVTKAFTVAVASVSGASRGASRRLGVPQPPDRYGQRCPCRRDLAR